MRLLSEEQVPEQLMKEDGSTKCSSPSSSCPPVAAHEHAKLGLSPSRQLDAFSSASRAWQGTRANVRRLQEDLAHVSQACATVREQGRPGSLFILLRKKWQLMQRLFEAENQQRLGR